MTHNGEEYYIPSTTKVFTFKIYVNDVDEDVSIDEAYFIKDGEDEKIECMNSEYKSMKVENIIGKTLIKGILRGSFSCFDMSMTIMPAYILSAVSIISNIGLGIWGAAIGDNIMIAISSIGETIFNMYLVLFIIYFLIKLILKIILIMF